MAKKNADDAGLRGVKLVKKAIEAGRAEALASPEPVAPVVLKKLVLPNGEPITSSMKELLKVDGVWLGIEYDEDEGDIEAVAFEDLLEDNFGKSALNKFAEASELLGGDCIVVGGASDGVRFLYIGETDESGEYPVIIVRNEPEPWVGGFVPFDVWLAQELGALPAPKEPGDVPPQYLEAAKALADANGDGRLSFKPTPGEGGDEEEDEEDEEEDEDDEDEEDEDEEDEDKSDEDKSDDEKSDDDEESDEEEDEDSDEDGEGEEGEEDEDDDDEEEDDEEE
jgi:hypothetical protein